MAQDKTVTAVSWEIVNGLQLHHTDKMYLANKIQDAIESYASQQVQKARREDAEIARSRRFTHLCSSCGLSDREEQERKLERAVALKIAQAIEAKAEEGK